MPFEVEHTGLGRRPQEPDRVRLVRIILTRHHTESRLPVTFVAPQALARKASEVVGYEARVLREPSEHPRADLLAVMKGETTSAHPTRLNVRCEPDSRLTCQPIRSSAASTRLALAAGHWLTPPW